MLKLNIPNNRILNRHGNICYIVLSLVIPSIVFVAGIAGLRVIPFGSHNLAISDGKFYINGAVEFGRLLRGDENWFYSLTGIGSNNWAALSWGGLSFGRFLSVFGNVDNMPALFTWICLTNISICGLTMYILLSGINGHRFTNLVFSTTYALIGFNVVNIYQTLFFMGPQMLPLVILGLFYILKGKSPLLYILSLAFCIFTDFYFGFHLCVISVVYFCAYYYVCYIRLKGVRRNRLKIWISSSLIAGLLAAPMWLPAIKAFSGGGRLNQTTILQYSFKEKAPFIQFFSKLFTGANNTDEIVDGLPAIFCGILIVALVILYFMNKSRNIRYKQVVGAVLAFYMISFYIPAFTIIMHGGTVTNWFPYRYSYVFSFLLICLAAEEFNCIDNISLVDAKKCGVILLVSAILIFSTKYDYISGGAVLLDFVFLLLIWIGFWLYKTRPEQAPFKVLSVFLMLIVCANLYANFIISIKSMQEWELDLNEYRKNTLINGALIDGLKQSDNSFFRMEKDASESDSVGADPLLYNYHGISGSGPTIRWFINSGLCKIGINWFDMRHWYSEGVPAATDSLLGIKYIISQRDLAKEKGYEEKVGIDGYKIYQDPNALSLAILSNGEIQKHELGDNLFENLNIIWKDMTGEEKNVFTAQKDVTYTMHNATDGISVTSKELSESACANGVNSKKDDSVSANSMDITSATTPSMSQSDTYIEYSFNASKEGPVYYFDTSIPSSESGLAVPAVRYSGYYSEGEKVIGKIYLEGKDYLTEDLLRNYCANIVFAYADNDVLARYAEDLNTRDISIDVVQENNLTGRFTAEKGQRILFTLPWDEGWTCYIDGEKTPIDKTWDLFMSVEVPEGNHIYEMRFVPAWINYGLMLCGVAFIGMIVLLIVCKRNN